MFQSAAADYGVIESYLGSVYEFRHNIVTGKTEFRKLSNVKFVELDDFNLNSIHRELKKEGLKINISPLRDLLHSDFARLYNPFIDFLESLPSWDQKTDYIEELAMTITTTDQDFWRKTLKKWFVAFVGSIYNEYVINHQVLVLVGPQGIGKSSWIIKLVPEQLKIYIYSGTINPENKDTLILLSECIIINLDELENLNKKEYGTLKELITKPSIKLRRPYGRVTENLPHRASFIGSVNHLEFLHDPTGSRRFLCHSVEAVNFKHEVDILKVYAQAFHLYKSGFKYYFEGGPEIQEILEKNRQYEAKTIEEDLVLRYCIPIPLNGSPLLTTTEISQRLKHVARLKDDLNIKNLGMALRKHFERCKVGKNENYGYAIKINE